MKKLELMKELVGEVEVLKSQYFRNLNQGAGRNDPIDN
jgi:hypothetical protein